jgi:hypothetical protein
MRMGSGVRFKALEAMAAGVPLVATTLGAAGSGATHEEHALIADDAAGFADALVRLLEEPHERQSLVTASRRLAEERHDWQRITPRLLDAYDRLLDRRGEVSVITTLLNERRSLGPLLASLRWQRQPPAEVVVADGGSTDGTRELLTASTSGGPPLRVVDASGANISQGRNRAIEAAAHDVIAATDGGVVLHPAWLDRLAAPLLRSPALHAVGGFFVAEPFSSPPAARSPSGATPGTLPAATPSGSTTARTCSSTSVSAPTAVHPGSSPALSSASVRAPPRRHSSGSTTATPAAMGRPVSGPAAMPSATPPTPPALACSDSCRVLGARPPPDSPPAASSRSALPGTSAGRWFGWHTRARRPPPSCALRRWCPW